MPKSTLSLTIVFSPWFFNVSYEYQEGKYTAKNCETKSWVFWGLPAIITCFYNEQFTGTEEMHMTLPALQLLDAKLS